MINWIVFLLAVAALVLNFLMQSGGL
jgi:hypothetical protein